MPIHAVMLLFSITTSNTKQQRCVNRAIVLVMPLVCKRAFITSQRVQHRKTLALILLPEVLAAQM